MNYHAIAAIWAFLLCLQIMSAQQAELTRFSFTVYGLRPGDYSNIYYEDARGEPAELKFDRKRRSQAYEAEILTKTPALKFLSKTTDSINNEVRGYRELSTVQLTQDPDKLLFVFVPQKNPDNVGSFRILPVEDTVSPSERGTVRIINLTGLTLFGMVDDERFELPSLSCSQTFRTVKTGQSDFSIIAEGSSRFHLVYRNSFSIDSESSALLFLTPPYRRVSLKLGGHMLYEELSGDAD